MTNMGEAPPAREGNGSLKDSRSESSSSTTPPLSSATSSGLVNGACLGVRSFVKKAWELGVNEPRKVIHCFKVGLALTFVSFFYYYMEPFYEGFGGNSTWVIMTVVVISEYTVGATLGKCMNRATGTFLAGFLGVGVHLIAAESGDRFEPIIVGVSVFLLASAATFSRFIPEIKARFDYGAMIFILTFSLVAVSSYREKELFELVHQRLSTILIGVLICILISLLVFPVWAGDELHRLVVSNLDKLANSLDCCVGQYFTYSEAAYSIDKDLEKKLEGYKFVLNSKATEESMAGFARWELAHGRFNFRHPWNLYLKIGTSMRNCACCIEALNTCLISENQAPEFIKMHLSNLCLTVSANSSNVIKELATIIKTMRKSQQLHLLILEMKTAVEQLQNDLNSLPSLLNPRPGLGVEAPVVPPLMEVIPVATFASLLIEIAARVEVIVDAVKELETVAEFRSADDDKPKQVNQLNSLTLSNDQRKEEETIEVLQRV